ncbi:hypothetical protein [Embleya sp. NPDC050493]|uniref:hypothetical protein n=1 Tax=Embleya sp. NPDC050493 TaxID=3363989 RepID=UPI0037AB1ECE
MSTEPTHLLLRRSMRHRISIDIGPESSAGPDGFPEGLPKPANLADRARSTMSSELPTRAAIALTVVTVSAAAPGWLVVGRVLRPIRAISATARRRAGCREAGEADGKCDLDLFPMPMSRVGEGGHIRKKDGRGRATRVLHRQRALCHNPTSRS